MARPGDLQELGRLIDSHRPVSTTLGWAIVFAISIPFALIPVLAAPNSLGLTVGLFVLVVLMVSFTYGLGEWLFLQHLLYEHGTVLRSLPGIRTFVVPHYSVDTASIQVAGRRVHDGGVVTSVEVGRVGSFRVTPLAAQTVRFDALDPAYARPLAKGKLDWEGAAGEYEHDGRQQVWKPHRSMVWALSHRDAEAYAQLLRSTVRASQQVYPYYRADQRR